MKAEKYLEMLDRLVAKGHPWASGYDHIIWILFHRYIDDVRYGIEEGDIYYFHKSFRQTDVIDSPGIDSVIWWSLSESKYALWLFEFMRLWNKEREVTEYDVFSAIMDLEQEKT